MTEITKLTEPLVNMVLSISATEYVKTVGRDMTCYTAKGVVVKEIDYRITKKDEKEYVVSGLPEGTEIIVNAQAVTDPAYNIQRQIYFGTALIRKE
ncbi:MAG: hypothetical protein ABIC91_08650 [Nanoarchaeota archaeon]|nr:hypothetical protein [Nanoarchaeota archaeon]MBU1030295.1 hypothetical protein [Nanoarchaeota archaeon]MBU1849308.1 hypothetical protein [Nanoarchaeota archaeon]